MSLTLSAWPLVVHSCSSRVQWRLVCARLCKLARSEHRATLSQAGGISNNPVLRIVVPDGLNKVVKLMRNIGFSGYDDELELAMNRSAECQ